VPTNLIREPLVSLTALQDPLARWLQSTAVFQAIAPAPISHQMFEWAQDTGFFPYQTFIAAAVDNATNTAQALVPRLVAACKSNIPPAIGIVHATTNHLGAFWVGLPMIQPSIAPVKDAGQDFLIGWMLPGAGKTNQLPHELLDRILGRTNLVAYDWEVTQPRLNHWRAMNNLLRFISQRPSLETNLPSQRFLLDAAPKLGNTVTELTVTATNQLTLTRKSHLGLTAFELVALTEWLDAEKFPHTDLVWPPEFKKRELPPGTKLPRHTATPAPPAAPVPPPSKFRSNP
jgi:hypothetical protein